MGGGNLKTLQNGLKMEEKKYFLLPYYHIMIPPPHTHTYKHTVGKNHQSSIKCIIYHK